MQRKAIIINCSLGAHTHVGQEEWSLVRKSNLRGSASGVYEYLWQFNVEERMGMRLRIRSITIFLICTPTIEIEYVLTSHTGSMNLRFI